MSRRGDRETDHRHGGEMPMDPDRAGDDQHGSDGRGHARLLQQYQQEENRRPEACDPMLHLTRALDPPIRERPTLLRQFV